MKKMLQYDVSELLSLYIDGQLNEEQTKIVEQLLKTDESVRQELRELQQLRHLLSSCPRVEHEETFWIRLSQQLYNKKSLPLPKISPYTQIAFTIASVILLLIAGVYLSLFLEQKVVTQSTIVVPDKKVFPLFTTLSNDDVLKFSLFGLLPFDQNRKTHIEVNETGNNGCQIKVCKPSDEILKNVTLDKFVTTIQPTKEQQQAIENLIEETHERLRSSVLVSDDQALAVDPELANYNKLILSKLVATLNPQQRKKLDAFLTTYNAPYRLNENAIVSNEIHQFVPKLPPKSKRRSFVVITPDTLLYTNHINIDSIETLWKQEIFALEQRRRKFVEQFMQQDFKAYRRETQNLTSQSIQNGIFQVEVTTSSNSSYQTQLPVVPRHPRRLTISPQQPLR